MTKAKDSFTETLEARKQTNIYAKLLKVKSEIGTLTKRADNPFFKSKYLELSDLLEAVEPVLEKHGLVLLQPIQEGEVTTIIIDTETGQRIISTIAMTSSNNPQQMGSQISYYRRYNLQSLLALQVTDDDGNQATKAKQTLDANRFDSALSSIEKGQYTVEKLKSEWALSVEQLEALENFVK